MIEPNTIEELRESVWQSDWIRPCGRGTKSALSAGATLSVKRLAGMIEYDPSEFTFTALAGTPLSEVQAALAENGQYLPFDPPWVQSGATLGGTVAAGLAGSGRYRFGGVGDFVIGTKIVVGDGRLISGGGKVVKNAAGFDIPKLMVGACGRFGVLAELSFKVFPQPKAMATITADCSSLPQALSLMQQLRQSPFELTALDLQPPSRLWMRICGTAAALEQRLSRLSGFLEGAGARAETVMEDRMLWRDVAEFAWAPAQHALIKLPLTAADIPPLEQTLQPLARNVPRRYTVGGNVAWLAWPEELEWQPLREFLQRQCRSALVLHGQGPEPPLAGPPSNAFLDRLISAFDPTGKFAPQPASQVA